MKNTTTYNKVDKFLHWLIAINLTATLIFANGMSSLTDEQKLVEYGDHGLSVTTILICMTIRLLWRFKHGFPALPDSMNSIEKISAKVVHYLFYVVIFSQIVIGIFLASTTKQNFIAKGYDINYSSLNLAPKELYQQILSLHIGLYYAIIALIFLHLGAALKHHYIDKDDVLRRMLPFQKSQ